MRRLLGARQVTGILLCVMLIAPSSAAVEPDPRIHLYLTHALNVLERNFVRRDEIDWEALREAVFARAESAVTLEDTYPAIELALEMLGERHSFFLTAEEAARPPDVRIDTGALLSESNVVRLVVPSSGAEEAGIQPGDIFLAVNGEPFEDDEQIAALPESVTTIQLTLRRAGHGEPITLPVERRAVSTNLPPSGRQLEGGIGYLMLPGHLGAGTLPDGRDYADMAQTVIQEIDAEPTCGWVVDLRQNHGGNMWPMLAGVGPILGEGEVGSFDFGERAQVWKYERGIALSGDHVAHRSSVQHELAHPDPPVAVLTSDSTASSGEAIVVAFRGRPHTRPFGEPTNGVPTSNHAFRLADDALLVVTVAYMVDRTGRAYDEPIEPDELVPIDWAKVGSDDDPVLLAALAWLEAQPACRG